MTATTVPISVAWTNARSPLSAKRSMKATIIADDKEDEPQRRGDDAGGAVDPRAASGLALEALVEPLGVGGLLGSGLWLDGPQRAQEHDAPRIHCVGLGPFSIRRHS
jgi:hypothetical protein